MAPRLARPPKPCPCLDFVFQYTLLYETTGQKNWGRMLGLAWLKFTVARLNLRRSYLLSSIYDSFKLRLSYKVPKRPNLDLFSFSISFVRIKLIYSEKASKITKKILPTFLNLLKTSNKMFVAFSEYIKLYKIIHFFSNLLFEVFESLTSTKLTNW